MSKLISTIVDDDTFTKFQSICDRNDTSKLKLLKRIIEAYLNNEKTIDLTNLKSEVWSQFIAKCKNTGKTKEHAVGMLIYSFIKEK